jgi:hypothetical protein
VIGPLLEYSPPPLSSVTSSAECNPVLRCATGTITLCVRLSPSVSPTCVDSREAADMLHVFVVCIASIARWIVVSDRPKGLSRLLITIADTGPAIFKTHPLLLY